LGSTGELGHVANVPNKIKKTENNSYPTDLIKTIPLEVNHSSFLEQKKNSPQHVPCGVTAVAAVLKAGPELHPECKNGKFCKSSRKKYQNEKLSEFFSIVDPMRT
jgi:hypothetical protein